MCRNECTLCFVSAKKYLFLIYRILIKNAIEKLEKEFAGNGRVLIRPSGTEPLVRVMIEGLDISDITDNDIILDIGPKTLELYKKYISASETIFLNGTVGKYEEEGFEDGTKEILDAVSKTEAYSVIGGGDALSSAEYFKINDFSFISTGGGATLNYIATEKLACFEE